MNASRVSEVEMELLLEAIEKVYGYDFRHYARSSLRRRLDHAKEEFGLKNYSQLQECILHDKEAFNLFLLQMSITVTEMFRDPEFYKDFWVNIIPTLKTYPYFKIWHAGCATGEEVYSTAIMLHEAGLLSRATIYATDFNNEAIEKAKKGIYKTTSIQKYIANYKVAGGNKDFSKSFETVEKSRVSLEPKHK
jgi:chemotaxis protein methyltransferase CheR